MSVEGLKSVFDVAAVVLLFLTFAAGAGVLITGNVISRRQEEKLRAFDSDLTSAKSSLAKQQQRAATAELEIEKLRQQAIPRRLSSEQRNRISSALSLFRGLQASLMRDNKRPEIWDLGEDIMAALDSRGAGWIVNDGSEPNNSLLGVKVELNKYATDRGVRAALALAKSLHEDAGLDISPLDISVVNLRGKEPAEENAVQIKITIGKKP